MSETRAPKPTVAHKRHFGITVLPEYIQCEGAEAVLERLVGRLGANVVVTSPYVAALADESTGGREPPLDGGAGSVRQLDRPLWGAKALHMRTSPSFSPDKSLYDARYAPPAPDDLTLDQGPLVANFLGKARAAGMQTYLQVMAAIPPCYRVQFGGPTAADKPLLPSGEALPHRVDNNASLAAEAVRDYVRAMVLDLCQQYPDVDGFKFDWPEYPPYHLLSVFADYNPQVAPYAARAGIDFDGLKAGMCQLLQQFRSGKLAGSRLELLSDGEDLVPGLIEQWPVLGDHFRLRRFLVADYAKFLREVVDEASGGAKKVALQGFPPPWNQLSGFDPAALEPHADALAIKFYTMHWPMMLQNYAQTIAASFPGQDDTIASGLMRLFFGQGTERNLSDIRYPEMSEPHGVSADTVARKFAAAQHGAVKPLIAVSHGYGPVEDVVSRFEGAWQASGGRVEINRYGYLSNAKIDAIAALVR